MYYICTYIKNLVELVCTFSFYKFFNMEFKEKNKNGNYYNNKGS